MPTSKSMLKGTPCPLALDQADLDRQEVGEGLMWGRSSFSIIFQLMRSENCKNAANPAFFELNCKLPKLRTWVRFPSPAQRI